jgi:hypothetical protein
MSPLVADRIWFETNVSNGSPFFHQWVGADVIGVEGLERRFAVGGEGGEGGGRVCVEATHIVFFLARREKHGRRLDYSGKEKRLGIAW